MNPTVFSQKKVVRTRLKRPGDPRGRESKDHVLGFLLSKIYSCFQLGIVYSSMEIHNLIGLNQKSLEITKVENVKFLVAQPGVELRVHQKTKGRRFFSGKIHLYLEQRNFVLVGAKAPLDPPPPRPVPPYDTG